MQYEGKGEDKRCKFFENIEDILRLENEVNAQELWRHYEYDREAFFSNANLHISQRLSEELWGTPCDGKAITPWPLYQLNFSLCHPTKHIGLPQSQINAHCKKYNASTFWYCGPKDFLWKLLRKKVALTFRRTCCCLSITITWHCVSRVFERILHSIELLQKNTYDHSPLNGEKGCLQLS